MPYIYSEDGELQDAKRRYFRGFLRVYLFQRGISINILKTHGEAQTNDLPNIAW